MFGKDCSLAGPAEASSHYGLEVARNLCRIRIKAFKDRIVEQFTFVCPDLTSTIDCVHAFGGESLRFGLGKTVSDFDVVVSPFRISQWA